MYHDSNFQAIFSLATVETDADFSLNAFFQASIMIV
jgi:hypothetical protein